MTVVKRKRIGGLILKRKDLQSILDEPGTEGIAFTLKKVGQSTNVQLNVMRVYAKGNILISEARKVSQTAGALSPLQYPASQASDFNFRYLEKLKKDKFSFGFYSKDSFQKLMQEDYWDEVFISGGIKNYGHEDFIGDQPDWFTFNISMRKGIKTHKNSKNGQRRVAVPVVDLKAISQNGVIHIDMLREKQPELFDNDRIVETVLVNEDNNNIEGLVLSNGKNNNTIMFADDTTVTSILLTEDQTLRKIFIDASLNKIANNVREEEGVLGGYPLTDFTVGCPPHWHMRKRNSKQNKYDNTVKDAILNALEVAESA